MKLLLALGMGCCSGLLFLWMLILLVGFVDASLPGWFLAVFCGAAWLLSTYLIHENARDGARVVCNGFLMLAFEWAMLGGLSVLPLFLVVAREPGGAEFGFLAIVATLAWFVGASAFCLLGFIVAHLVGQEYRTDAQLDKQGSAE